MNKMESEIKAWKGNVLIIGELEDRIMDIIHHHNQIKMVDQLQQGIGMVLPFQGKKQRKQRVEIKKIKKKYAKKSIDIIFCTDHSILPYLRHFVRNSIAICSGKIYYMIPSIEDYETVIKRYQRYSVSCKQTVQNECMLLVFEIGNTQNKWWSEKLYWFVDLLSDFFDLITNFISL